MNKYTDLCEEFHDKMIERHYPALSGPPRKVAKTMPHIDRDWSGVPAEYKTDRYPSDYFFLELLVNLRQTEWPERRADPETVAHSSLLLDCQWFDLSCEDKKRGLMWATVPGGHVLSIIRYLAPEYVAQHGLKGRGAQHYLFNTKTLQNYVASNLKRLKLKTVKHIDNPGWTGVGVLLPISEAQAAGLLQQIDVTQEWMTELLPTLPPMDNRRRVVIDDDGELTQLENDDDEDKDTGAMAASPLAAGTNSQQGIGDGQQRSEVAGLAGDGRD